MSRLDEWLARGLPVDATPEFCSHLNRKRSNFLLGRLLYQAD